jgi:hypothetical protein
MKTVHRKPDFRIEIIRPNLTAYQSPVSGISSQASFYQTSTHIVTFLPNKTVNANGQESNALTSYSFQESLHGVEAPFSLTVTAETGRRNATGTRPMMDSMKATWFERLRPFDVVYIWEFAELRYIGIVHDINISANISSDSSARQITVSGSYILSILSSFNIILNQYLMAAPVTATGANVKLFDELSQYAPMGSPVSSMLKTIYRSFMSYMSTIGQVVEGDGVSNLVTGTIDMDNGMSNETITQFDLHMDFYQVGGTNLWNMFQTLCPAPIYELFGRINSSTKKCDLVFRETPFDMKSLTPDWQSESAIPTGWNALPLTLLPMHYVSNYNFTISDREVYTFFEGILEGAGYNESGPLLLDNGDPSSPSKSTIGTVSIDTEHWKRYGYRPMLASFRYFDRNQAFANYTGAAKAMALLGARLLDWNNGNDYQLNGSLTMMTNDPTKLDTPRVGNRLQIAGTDLQFYIEETSHHFSYGSPMTTQLTLKRGAGYSGGAMSYEDAMARLIAAEEQMFAQMNKRHDAMATMTGGTPPPPKKPPVSGGAH